MMRCVVQFSVAAVLATMQVTHSSSAYAIWPSSVDQQIVLGYQRSISELGCAPDGSGGVVVVFQELDPFIGLDLRGNRFDKAGASAVSGSFSVCEEQGDTRDLRIVPLPGGGCYVIWTDTRAGQQDIVAQKMNGFGQKLFAASGQPLITGASEQRLEHAVEDGAGGFIIVYSSSGLLLAQRFNGNGTAVWPSSQILSDTAGDFVGSMISDGNSGAVIGLETTGVGSEVGIVEVSAGGSVGIDRLLSNNAAGNQSGVKLARRLDGTVLAAWFDGGVSPSRIVTTEFVDPLVLNPLVPLNTGDVPVQSDFELIPSLYGDPIIAFTNLPPGGSSETRVGRVSTAGQLPPSGVAAIPGGTQTTDNLVETPSGLIRVTINQSEGPGSILYAVQISRAGQVQWIRAVTPADGSHGSTVNAALINGSQESLIVFSRQTIVSQPVRFALIRIRANGTVGGEQFGSDGAFGQSSITAFRKKKKATLMGDVVVVNQGTLPTAPTTAAFYLSPTPGFTSLGATFLFEVPVPALQPQESLVLQPGQLPPKKPGKKPKVRKVKLPKVVLTQQHYIVIQLDGQNADPELDENNNTYVFGPI